MKARVHIALKAGVLDPQGEAIHDALNALGFDGVREVRQGKTIDLDLEDADEAGARARIERMCEKLLANATIETYAIELRPETAAVRGA